VTRQDARSERHDPVTNNTRETTTPKFAHVCEKPRTLTPRAFASSRASSCKVILGGCFVGETTCMLGNCSRFVPNALYTASFAAHLHRDTVHGQRRIKPKLKRTCWRESEQSRHRMWLWTEIRIFPRGGTHETETGPQTACTSPASGCIDKYLRRFPQQRPPWRRGGAQFRDTWRIPKGPTRSPSPTHHLCAVDFQRFLVWDSGTICAEIRT
jgi:hypothetical protein